MEKTIRKIFFFNSIFLCVFFLSGFAWSASQYSGYLYFIKGNNLWVNDLSSDSSTRLTRLDVAIGPGSIANPSISSDGTKIVFSYKTSTGSETMLYSVNTDGSGLENLSLTHNLGGQTKNQSSGSYSPDMTKIVFTAEMRNPGPVAGFQLWMKELTGLKRLFQLTLMNGDCSDAQFVDDTHILFKHKYGFLEDYYLISTDGSDLTNLTNNAILEPYFPRLGRPVLNRNRSFFYYARQDQDPNGYSNWKIYRYNIQAGSSTDIETELYFAEQPLAQDDPHPIAITDSEGVDTAIVFSGKSPFSQTKSLYIEPIGAENPYSRMISNSDGAFYPLFYPVKARPSIFVFTSGTPSQVFLRDSSNQTLQLTSTVGNNYDPVLDSTGSLIAYAGNGIWVMRADGTNSVQIDQNFMARYPAFSPDSNWVAYIVANDIYVRRVDLAVPAIRLTYTPNIEKSDLCFSPSGSAIIYTGSTASGRQIFSMPVSISSTNIAVTGSPVDLTRTPGCENYHPSFSSDGSKIVFVSTRQGSAYAYSMNADGSGQTLVIAQPGLSYPQFSPWNDNKIAFLSGGSVRIIDLETGQITEVSPQINPTGKFSWAKSIPYRINIKRQFVYNRADPNLAYYYCLNIVLDRINKPSAFIITEQLPAVANGASADWKITGAWFNGIALSPLTSSGNTTGTVKWIVSNSIGSIFPLTDGTLLLKIGFVGSPNTGDWNYVNGSVTDGSTRIFISGDSYLVYGNPDFPPDSDSSKKISDVELLTTIDYWATNSRINGWPIDLRDWDYWLLKAIDFWAKGGYVYTPATEPSWTSI
ncbi:MAG: DPP IV N-terminal domain-containing protein [Candidatus Omnitrophica bacterium]|nr:DPP IV N-terminal domain-containing protein [Candidatus Omnitrophota bacterium]